MGCNVCPSVPSSCVRSGAAPQLEGTCVRSGWGAPGAEAGEAGQGDVAREDRQVRVGVGGEASRAVHRRRFQSWVGRGEVPCGVPMDWLSWRIVRQWGRMQGEAVGSTSREKKGGFRERRGWSLRGVVRFRREGGPVGPPSSSRMAPPRNWRKCRGGTAGPRKVSRGGGCRLRCSDLQEGQQQRRWCDHGLRGRGWVGRRSRPPRQVGVGVARSGGPW